MVSPPALVFSIRADRLRDECSAAGGKNTAGGGGGGDEMTCSRYFHQLHLVCEYVFMIQVEHLLYSFKFYLLLEEIDIAVGNGLKFS